MNEPRWLDLDEVLIIHERQLARFGGALGVRDRGALESALDRPKNRWAYEGAATADLAAAYAFGLSRNHPFGDGNKRVAFVAMVAFLRLNGVAFRPPQENATIIMLDLAAGLVSEESLARWVTDNWPAL